ncbi:cytochrome P450 [Gongronella butleri]|nr:cytochrome P450 [Gongronella butleri]
MTDKTIIVALKGSIAEAGKPLHLSSGVSLDTVRQMAAETLGICVNQTHDLLLYTSSDKLLGGVDDLWQQQLIYVDLPCHIQDVIPGPAKLPFVGNLYDLMPNMDVSFMRLFEKYGPLLDVTIMGRRMLTTNDPLIAEQLVKENEFFTKKIAPTALREVQKFAGDGLFTSDTDASHWKLAHKLLMPAFSPRAIKAYQEEMGHITMQTLGLFDQFKAGEEIDILDWTTKITFETIGRTGFGYDFGLLDGKDAEPHPMIEAMKYLLEATVSRGLQMEFMKHLPTPSNRKFDDCVSLMHKIVLDVVKERKSSPDAKDANKDLLGFMLNAVDEHDDSLTDENIRDQVVTFLIAGHDTTANTLAWFFYELSRHPEIQAKVLQEIANVGITSDKLPTVEQVNSLKYTMQVIKETLRMYPPVRRLFKYCRQDCVVPYGYKIPGDTSINVNVYSLHHNESVYPNSFQFDPERFTPEEEQKRSPAAWLPFSTGLRACIGRPFSLQEAKTVIAMILHKYEFKYDGPDVEFDPRTATTKPAHLMMTIHPRSNFPEPTPDASLPSLEKTSTPPRAIPRPVAGKVDAAKQAQLPNLTFLYGTQTGTAQDYANQLYQQAKEFGFLNVKMAEMDKWDGIQGEKYESPAQKELVIVCTATYNGYCPDTAERFNKFLDKKMRESTTKHFDGLLYAVFGVGNKNWRTYQKFPIKVDDALDQLGATRFFARGEGNADEDMDADFNMWSAHFWSFALDAYGLSASVDKSVVPVEANSKLSSASIKIRYLSPSDANFTQGTRNTNTEKYNKKAFIKVNRELQQSGSDRSTRHIELDVRDLTPVANAKEGLLYVTGDHLEVMPENDAKLVETIGLNFGWVLDSVFQVDEASKKGVSPRSLAGTIATPCTIRNALTYYANISSPPSRLLLHCFAQQLRKATDDATADAFEAQIVTDANGVDPYPKFIQAHRTLLDVQRAYPQVKDLDFGQFLAAAGVMQPRRYSIASSPLTNKGHASLTVGVVDDLVQGRHYPGLASSYLSRCLPLSPKQETIAVRAAFKSAKSTFGLPDDAETPIIMIAAGTGLSPFMGFLQERAWQKQQGDAVGKTVLFFGCRRADQDYIYKEELATFQDQEVLTSLHVAFSRQNPASADKYVQHQILLQAAAVWSFMHPTDGSKAASIFICGSGKMSQDVRKVFLSLIKSFGAAQTSDDAEKVMQDWIDQGRYNEDVWG